ncbi:Protoporphyrinogen oxidase 1, chloroplastic [Auxenochlorella protothecoides]|uniref:Protoporphyrinogen oxidase n=1 Tax=Auxenochlorella protothecoides TaxID=3075 RepID=A0A087SQM0_AUXPR|nr:Protoporphyrinogen oxidase 1, chloroplastic [Auxenochlorella protothecoides]KFM28024.1 Protoporphyrinogen oxidase 1, chloroplastic [Auxenochlorella protothecoides]
MPFTHLKPLNRLLGSPRARHPHVAPQAVSVTNTSTTRPGGRSSAPGIPGDAEYDVVIVGAGISGLTTAQALAKQYSDAVPRLLVTEARDCVGGNIITRRDGGYQWEEGPNSFQPSDAVLRAAVDAGVADRLVLGDPKAPRYVYWGGRLRATPSGPDVLTFDLLSLWGKLRAGLGAAGFKAPLPEREESVKEFVTRNLGEEVFQRLIEPFCSGVYAGDPAKLSMKAAFGKVYDLEKGGGSIVGGVLALMKARKQKPPEPRPADLPPKPKGQTVGSFDKGLVTLPSAIAEELGDRVVTGWKLESIDRSGDRFQLTYDTPQGRKKVSARSVALTVPAYTAASLLESRFPKLGKALSSIYYPPVASVALSYPETAILPERLGSDGHLAGFGQLHPRTQGVTTLGTIYASSLFPGRVPEGKVLLLSYFGGATNTRVATMPHGEIVSQVDKDLRKMLIRSDAESPHTVNVTVWPRAIPQFNVGHTDLIQEAKDDLASQGWQGLHLGGNYVAGVALGKCMEAGYKQAAELASHVKSLAT